MFFFLFYECFAWVWELYITRWWPCCALRVRSWQSWCARPGLCKLFWKTLLHGRKRPFSAVVFQYSGEKNPWAPHADDRIKQHYQISVSILRTQLNYGNFNWHYLHFTDCQSCGEGQHYSLLLSEDLSDSSWRVTFLCLPVCWWSGNSHKKGSVHLGRKNPFCVLTKRVCHLRLGEQPKKAHHVKLNLVIWAIIQAHQSICTGSFYGWAVNREGLHGYSRDKSLPICRLLNHCNNYFNGVFFLWCSAECVLGLGNCYFNGKRRGWWTFGVVWSGGLCTGVKTSFSEKSDASHQQRFVVCWTCECGTPRSQTNGVGRSLWSEKKYFALNKLTNVWKGCFSGSCFKKLLCSFTIQVCFLQILPDCTRK